MSLENTHFGALRIESLLRGCDSIFFIGIGGISMSSLAQLSAKAGYRVGGSDRTRSALTDALERQGIEIFTGHDAEHIENYGAVIYTVAIGQDNPEYLAAKERGLPLISRADYLGYLMMDYRRRVGISGMHGKSTCTAMCASIFLEAGDATVLCGAEIDTNTHSSCRIGRENEQLVFEACEYMDSFLDFNPTLAVILNIGMDHVDYFHSIEQIRESFLHYAERTASAGAVLYNLDDPECERAMEHFEGEKVTFGIRHDAEFTAQNVRFENDCSVFDLYRGEDYLCHILLPVCGKHNIYNALAAASAAILCGIDPQHVAHGLADFHGAKRRMEFKGKRNGAVIYDDYGHHPDEIKATLSAARQMGYRRVFCAYQPHTYSRTAGLMDAFSTAFSDADRVFMVDIYAAREENVYGVSSALLAERIGDKARYCGSFQSTAEAILEEARDGDLVIVMGAGDVFKVFDHLFSQEEA